MQYVALLNARNSMRGIEYGKPGLIQDNLPILRIAVYTYAATHLGIRIPYYTFITNFHYCETGLVTWSNNLIVVQMGLMW